MSISLASTIDQFILKTHKFGKIVETLLQIYCGLYSILWFSLKIKMSVIVKKCSCKPTSSTFMPLNKKITKTRQFFKSRIIFFNKEFCQSCRVQVKCNCTNKRQRRKSKITLYNCLFQFWSLQHDVRKWKRQDSSPYEGTSFTLEYCSEKPVSLILFQELHDNAELPGLLHNLFSLNSKSNYLELTTEVDETVEDKHIYVNIWDAILTTRKNCSRKRKSGTIINH